MTAARPPGLSRRRKRARKSSSVFFVLTICEQVLGAVLVIERPGKGRIGEDERVFFLLARVVLGEGVAVADVGVFHAVQEHVHAADAEHGVVEVEPVEEVVVEVFLEPGVAEDFRVVLAEVFAGGHEEAGRAAGGVANDVLGRWARSARP